MPKDLERREADDAADAHEARVQADLDQQFSDLKQDSRAILRAVKGRRGVSSEAHWEQIYDEARRDYASGRFLVEQLGAERFLEPRLMATLIHLRQDLVAEQKPASAADMMLIDLAVLSYYNALRIQGWIGNINCICRGPDGEFQPRERVER